VTLDPTKEMQCNYLMLNIKLHYALLFTLVQGFSKGLIQNKARGQSQYYKNVRRVLNDGLSFSFITICVPCYYVLTKLADILYISWATANFLKTL